MHDVNILSAAEYRWPEQFDQNAFSVNDYREHYAYGDSILIWDETNEEIQTLSKLISFFNRNFSQNRISSSSSSQAFHGHSKVQIVTSNHRLSI